jgi:hypothetical protein
MNPATTLKGIVMMIAFINPIPLPALRIAGALFLIIYLLAASISSGTGVGILVATRGLMVTMRPLAIYASKSF